MCVHLYIKGFRGKGKYIKKKKKTIHSKGFI